LYNKAINQWITATFQINLHHSLVNFLFMAYVIHICMHATKCGTCWILNQFVKAYEFVKMLQNNATG